MDMGSAPTWLRQVSPLDKTTLTTARSSKKYHDMTIRLDTVPSLGGQMDWQNW